MSSRLSEAFCADYRNELRRVADNRRRHGHLRREGRPRATWSMTRLLRRADVGESP